ncbi:MAG TPA: signal recognition particle-docking protein FtsY [Candidatus Acidoferrales bacterium]|jgi:fused signal recognition particle receptor|nr:signal recognition particle-docking protein FtsY [Candidatus Acidoferrales bacterium]
MFSIFGKSKSGEEKPAKSLIDRLKDSVSKTRFQLAARVEGLFSAGKTIDPAVLKQLENALLAADIGVRTTHEVLDAVREKVDRHALSDAGELKAELKRQILARLSPAPPSGNGAGATPAANPSSTAAAETAVEGTRVIFMVGVNGVGKTTTMGKLANRLREEGHTVLLCAADTFRAAAIEQLEVWAQRAGVEIIKQKPGADPAAVVYDAVAAARARGIDAVIVDTAGRLHTKFNLMAELDKMKRTAAKIIPGAPHEILLVMDATTGQNGLVQAREFTGAVGVTGIVLTKLDGTAKGGIVVAITRELGLPVRFVGVGEKMEDLVPFDAESFVNSLFD